MSATFSATHGTSENRRARAGRFFAFDQAGIPRPGESAWTTSAMRQHRTVRNGEYVSRQRPDVVHTAGNVRRLQGRALQGGYGRIDERDRSRVIVDLTGSGTTRCVDPRGTTRVGVSLFPGRIPPKADLLVRCRRCLQCLLAKQGGWKSRALDEIVQARRARFCTLSFSPETHFRCEMIARRDASVEGVAWHRLTSAEKFDRQEKVLYRQHVAPIVQNWRGTKTSRKHGYVPFRYLLIVEKHDGKRSVCPHTGARLGDGRNKGRPHYHLLVMETSSAMLLNERMEAVVARASRKAARLLGASVKSKDETHEIHLQSNVVWDLAPPKGHKVKHDASVVRYATKYIAKDASHRVRASLLFGKLPGMRRHRTKTGTDCQSGSTQGVDPVRVANAGIAPPLSGASLNFVLGHTGTTNDHKNGGGSEGVLIPSAQLVVEGEKNTTTTNDDAQRWGRLTHSFAVVAAVPVLKDELTTLSSGEADRAAGFQSPRGQLVQHPADPDQLRVGANGTGQRDSAPDRRSDSEDSAKPDAGRLGRPARSVLEDPHPRTDWGGMSDEAIRAKLLASWDAVAPWHSRPSRGGIGFLSMPEAQHATYASPEAWQASLRQSRDADTLRPDEIRESGDAPEGFATAKGEGHV